MIVDGEQYPNYLSEDELQARIRRSRGYCEACWMVIDPKLGLLKPGAELKQHPDWLAGWNHARALDSSIESPADANVQDHGKSIGADGSPRSSETGGEAGTDGLARRGVSESRVRAEGDRTVAVHSGDLRDHGPIARPSQADAIIQNGANGDRDCLRPTIAVVDFMNLFVRAWHAGQPSRIHAVRGMLETLANTLPRLWPDYLVFALDGGHRQRLELYPQYKAGRPPKPPEMVEQIAIAMQAFDVPMAIADARIRRYFYAMFAAAERN